MFIKVLKLYSPQPIYNYLNLINLFTCLLFGKPWCLFNEVFYVLVCFHIYLTLKIASQTDWEIYVLLGTTNTRKYDFDIVGGK